jgi:hypothetical protein
MYEPVDDGDLRELEPATLSCWSRTLQGMALLLRKLMEQC